MILEYVGCPDPPGSPGHYELPDFEVGQRYEVAEILEMEGHLMARVPDTSRWPAPGEPRFGIHPEWFEPTDEPIPILSCGYEYNDVLCDFFGVVLSERQHIEIMRALRRLEGPDDENGETFDAWYVREASSFPRVVAEAVYDWLFHYPSDFGVISDAVLVSGADKAPFAYMGVYGDAMFCMDIRHADLKRCIDRLLRALGIQDVEAGVVQVSYWRGNGGPRLLNPTTPEKFLYGLEYEFDSDESDSSSSPQGSNL